MLLLIKDMDEHARFERLKQTIQAHSYENNEKLVSILIEFLMNQVIDVEDSQAADMCYIKIHEFAYWYDVMLDDFKK